MKIKILLVFTGLLFFSVTFGQKDLTYENLLKEATTLYQNGSYKASVKTFEQAFKIENDNPGNLYNCACSASLAKDKKKALYWLNKALINGYNDLSHLQTDADLYYLHPLPEWKDIILKAKLNESKIKKGSEVASDIINNLKSNKSEEIFKLFSDKNNLNQHDFNLRINEINSLLKQKNKGELVLQNSSNSFKYDSANREIANYAAYYKYISNFFGEQANNFFLKQIGSDINLFLEKETEVWQLDSLTFDYNYFSDSYNIKECILDFISEKNTCDSKISYLKNPKNIIVGLTEIQSEYLSKTLNEIQFSYLNLTEFNYQNETSDVYTLSLVTENKKNSTNSIFDDFFSTGEKKYLQFAFFDNESNVILVSTGEKYAFYKVNQIEKIKEIIDHKLQIKSMKE